jgi:HK97 gp10 family phage protein
LANFDFKITGAKELAKRLDGLPGKIAKKSLRNAVRAGAVPIRDAARRNCPIETSGKHPGALRKSIRISTSAREDDGATTATAKVKAGDKVAFYGHFVEYGTAPHSEAPSVKKALKFADGTFAAGAQHPGATPKPFMRPAADSEAANAVAAITDRLKTDVEKFAKE